MEHVKESFSLEDFSSAYAQSQRHLDDPVAWEIMLSSAARLGIKEKEHAQQIFFDKCPKDWWDYLMPLMYKKH